MSGALGTQVQSPVAEPASMKQPVGQASVAQGPLAGLFEQAARAATATSVHTRRALRTM
jgi:hypothetical protein